MNLQYCTEAAPLLNNSTVLRRKRQLELYYVPALTIASRATATAFRATCFPVDLRTATQSSKYVLEVTRKMYIISSILKLLLQIEVYISN